MWDLETNKVLNAITSKNATKVLFQAPEGLKRAVEKEIEYLKTKTSVELMIWGETCFGACDLCDEEVKILGIDLIIHYGHEELAYVHSEIPVLFIHAYFMENEYFLQDVKNILEDMENTTVTTTIQFKKALKMFNPVVILGCRAPVENAEKVLFVGTGRFHPLMMAYKLKKTVKIYNPITREISEINDQEIKKLIKLRVGRVSKLLLNPPKKIGVVLSTKKGQCRLKSFEKVIELLRKNNIEYIPIVLNNISQSYLIYNVDAYIICACPRIVMDDYTNYESTLITPEELKMYISKDFEYKFDEILENNFY
ncbi:diphthamide biosynthesis protein [Methanococcus vannielii SB]|uniref:2-(3-amino-3-carboxypropyl)histidine synthase n=1 Tax=Methanococcus vannielii (strain ATCC 35089 / DSM 1224 / JCM 13029 / OCM 148 / SB) TaxID=406327 RepID=A6URG6_METVS|nr:diphthamide biosynthesis enzyme Dph2 [Methanococcus vannielii]ABR55088.1 diphthamide biosynthesis protein [Methanococcus vannielii SB]